MTVRISNGEAKYVKSFFSIHNKIGEAIADLTFAIASGSQLDVAKSHDLLLRLAAALGMAVDIDYRITTESKPGPKKGRKSAKKGAAK
jgi:hypothetical protein